MTRYACPVNRKMRCHRAIARAPYFVHATASPGSSAGRIFTAPYLGRKHGTRPPTRGRPRWASEGAAPALTYPDQHMTSHGAGQPRPADQAIPGPRARRSTDEEGADDHVDISPERDYTLSRGAAGRPRAGSEMSWRNTPQNMVTLQVLGAVMLLCLGLLLGTSWTIQAVQPKLRRQAEERRRLNEEWLAVRAARRRQDECPRCAVSLMEQPWYYPDD